ncbi:MAG: hypothetical protein H5T60_08875 [Anaerolineae bacterium]|nr:hypothetical protein [Anaerolineae bacterium]
MDPQAIAQLADQVVKALQPVILSFFQSAAVEAGRRAAGAAWESLAELWEKLRSRSRVEEAAQELAGRPDDPDAQAALRLAVRKALEADPALAEQVAGIMGRPQVVSYIKTGDVKGARITGVQTKPGENKNIYSKVETNNVTDSTITGVDLTGEE